MTDAPAIGCGGFLENDHVLFCHDDVRSCLPRRPGQK